MHQYACPDTAIECGVTLTSHANPYSPLCPHVCAEVIYLHTLECQRLTKNKPRQQCGCLSARACIRMTACVTQSHVSGYPSRLKAPANVPLRGSFDFWTRGVDMSSPDADGGDSMQRSFETTLSLVPHAMPELVPLVHCILRLLFDCRGSQHIQGTYLIKFLVDNQWRCAPGWPIESSSDGDNNVLHVDPLP
eukprot:scaffold43060_cov18-Tisochrysis_lutea.AAC.2